MKYVLLFTDDTFAEVDHDGSHEAAVAQHCDHHQMPATVVKVLKIQNQRFVQYRGYTIDIECVDA